MKVQLTPPGYSCVRIPGAPDYGMPKPTYLAPAPPITLERSDSSILLRQGSNHLELDSAKIAALKLDGLKPAKGPGYIDIKAVLTNGMEQSVICHWVYSREVANWLAESQSAIESIFQLPLDLNFSDFEYDI